MPYYILQLLILSPIRLHQDLYPATKHIPVLPYVKKVYARQIHQAILLIMQGRAVWSMLPERCTDLVIQKQLLLRHLLPRKNFQRYGLIWWVFPKDSVQVNLTAPTALNMNWREISFNMQSLAIPHLLLLLQMRTVKEMTVVTMTKQQIFIPEIKLSASPNLMVSFYIPWIIMKEKQ